MYLNNYILPVLYLILFLIYFSFIFNNKLITINAPLKRIINKLLIIVIIGLISSSIVGYINGTFPTSMSKIDTLRMLNFLVIFMLPLIFSRSKFCGLLKKSKNYLKIGILIFNILILFSLVLKGPGGSIYYGHFFAATTITITIISIFTFLGLFFYYKDNDLISLIIVLTGYFVSIASLVKWNFIVDVTVPFLLYKILKRRYSTSKTRLFLFYLSAFLLVLFLFNKSPELFNSFAKLNNYGNITDYINGRVLRSQTTSSLINSGIAFSIGNGEGIKDGARLLIWKDMLSRLVSKPIFGLGLGVRAFDYEGMNVEDHNMFVFFITIFGVILFVLLIYLLYKAFKYFYLMSHDNRYPFKKKIFLILIISFLFQASVGQIWGQLPVTIAMGLSVFYFIIPEYNVLQ